MKKTKAIAAALALCLLCCSFCSVTAFAAEAEPQTSASTSLLYTIQGGYTIQIPASVDLNSEEAALIKATELVLPSWKDLVVRIVSASTFEEDGSFMLTGPNGAKLSVDLCRSVYDKDGYSEFILKRDAMTDPVVALFSSTSYYDGELATFVPDQFGRIWFDVGETQGLVAGDYAGTINFSIGLEDHKNS